MIALTTPVAGDSRPVLRRNTVMLYALALLSPWLASGEEVPMRRETIKETPEVWDCVDTADNDEYSRIPANWKGKPHFISRECSCDDDVVTWFLDRSEVAALIIRQGYIREMGNRLECRWTKFGKSDNSPLIPWPLEELPRPETMELPCEQIEYSREAIIAIDIDGHTLPSARCKCEEGKTTIDAVSGNEPTWDLLDDTFGGELDDLDGWIEKIACVTWPRSPPQRVRRIRTNCSDAEATSKY